MRPRVTTIIVVALSLAVGSAHGQSGWRDDRTAFQLASWGTDSATMGFFLSMNRGAPGTLTAHDPTLPTGGPTDPVAEAAATALAPAPEPVSMAFLATALVLLAGASIFRRFQGMR